MPQMTKQIAREIIDDFAKEIKDKQTKGPKPAKTVINFRTEMHDGFEREVVRVPIEILRYRKDNGRIASDVKDYENNIGVLDERSELAQTLIEEFLKEKDPEKTAVLKSTLAHIGQQDPAIITCDGFLVNGNRRKMVMQQLHQDSPNDESYMYMKVVVLPGKGDEGGPPTLLEIEKLENRYQLQSDGKAEYYGFDRALSIKRKIEMGLSLEEQLRDDPLYARATKAELDKAIKKYKEDYLEPLECIDRYLKQFKREGQYRTISGGRGDPEGRWQAFIDYSNTYKKILCNPKRLLELDIEEDNIGEIEEAAFDIIRLRTIPEESKVHYIMRDLAKYCSTKAGKRAIVKIAEKVDPVLPRNELMDENGEPLSPNEVDAKWITKNQEEIIYNVKNAKKSYSQIKEKETPIGLLEAALKKLNHDDVDLSKIALSDIQKARGIISDIQDRAVELNKELYRFEKQRNELGKKK